MLGREHLERGHVSVEECYLKTKSRLCFTFMDIEKEECPRCEERYEVGTTTWQLVIFVSKVDGFEEYMPVCANCVKEINHLNSH